MENIPATFLDFTQKPDFKDILTNPILDIAARFWEDDRYDAFKICYRSMRIIDDLVDDRKSENEKLSAAEKKELETIIESWLERFQAGQASDDFQRALLDIKNKFSIPIWPWIRLSRAMIYDLYHDNFSSFLQFLRYSEGAAISPASIFMHLCGVRKSNNGFLPPSFDIRDAARTLALFSYIVHIIRDFQKDQLNNLNYFAVNRLKKHQLSKNDLQVVAKGGPIPDNFRDLMQEYFQFAGYYQKAARKKVDSILPHLNPQYQLSLEIIYQLYSQIYERVNIKTGDFSETELQPAPDEVKSRIDKTIAGFSVKN